MFWCWDWIGNLTAVCLGCFGLFVELFVFVWFWVLCDDLVLDNDLVYLHLLVLFVLLYFYFMLWLVCLLLLAWIIFCFLMCLFLGWLIALYLINSSCLSVMTFACCTIRVLNLTWLFVWFGWFVVGLRCVGLVFAVSFCVLYMIACVDCLICACFLVVFLIVGICFCIMCLIRYYFRLVVAILCLFVIWCLIYMLLTWCWVVY